MLKREKYKIRDGVSRFNAADMNPIFWDIDGRLHTLEGLKVQWEAAVADIQQHGLERINSVIAPVLDEADTILAEASQALGGLQEDRAAIQAWWDALTETIALLEAYTKYSYQYVDAAALGDPPDGVEAAEATTLDVGGVRLDVRAFDGTTAQHAQFKLRAPDDWDGDMTVKADWIGGDGCASGDGVAWDIKATAVGPGQAPGGAWGATVTVLDVVGTPGNQEECTTGEITAGGAPAGGSMVYFDFARDPGHESDTMGPVANLLGLAIQFGTTGQVEAW